MTSWPIASATPNGRPDRCAPAPAAVPTSTATLPPASAQRPEPRTAPEEFRRRIRLSGFAEAGIYPGVRDREDEADIHQEYLASYYTTLRSYVETLARDGLGMLVDVN
jgi:hypothetical protein